MHVVPSPTLMQSLQLESLEQSVTPGGMFGIAVVPAAAAGVGIGVIVVASGIVAPFVVGGCVAAGVGRGVGIGVAGGGVGRGVAGA